MKWNDIKTGFSTSLAAISFIVKSKKLNQSKCFNLPKVNLERTPPKDFIRNLNPEEMYLGGRRFTLWR